LNILLDHNIPAPLKNRLPGHLVKTARELGWDNLSNGLLLAAAEGGFDLLLTGDKNLRYQQNLTNRTISIAILNTTHWPTLSRHLPELQSSLDQLPKGSFIEIYLGQT
jgi:hypothetical protein